MLMKKTGQFLVLAASKAVLATPRTLFADGVIDLNDVFAPVVVGVQPKYAVHDLCVAADGEIRHYGQQMRNGKVQRVYVASRDNGLSWKTYAADKNDVGAMMKSPYSGEWIYFREEGDFAGSLSVVRSKIGPGDTKPEVIKTPWNKLGMRQLLAMKSRKRWIAAFVDVTCANGDCYRAVTMYSDDDGRAWKRVNVPPVKGVERLSPGDKRPHWYNDGCEPTVAELKDGSLLLAVRTSGPHAAFFRSTDGGESWGEGAPNPSFWQANTMPYLFTLSDGRLLFIWNNTQMLPTRDVGETPELGGGERSGAWEAVFTNRDALHAAISDDDGKTWKGFREIALNEIRNAPDFRELGNDEAQEKDKSVHQSQAIELPGGKVLLAYGQNVAARRLAIFDPNWLLETKIHEDFRTGLDHISNHLYLRSHSGGWRGWAGHCCWNRLPGAVMVRNPDLPDTNRGEVLQLCRIRDPRLVSDRQGIVWNFPAARKGMVSVNCQIVGEGFLFTLAERWINPCDETNPGLCPLSFPVTAAEAPKNAARLKGWHDVAAEWDSDTGKVKISVDGKPLCEKTLAYIPPSGLSYLHLQTLAEGHDPDGTLFRCFHKEN